MTARRPVRWVVTTTIPFAALILAIASARIRSPTQSRQAFGSSSTTSLGSPKKGARQPQALAVAAQQDEAAMDGVGVVAVRQPSDV